MTKKTTTQCTCDECGKTLPCETDYQMTPRDPWLLIRMNGGFITDFGRAADLAERHACSPACAAQMLEKVTDEVKRLVARFPNTTKEP